jgi:hypothetical protein
MRARAAILVGCALLTGCSSLSAPSTTSKLAQAQATHQYPAPAPPAETITGGGAPGAVAAIKAFATVYINWTASTVARRMLALAAGSVGQARSVVALAASETAGDYELRRGGIANSGTVEAVAPLSDHANEYVVVTRERTTATNSSAYAGLAPAWHVTLATVRQVAAGVWAVSGWQPES